MAAKASIAAKVLADPELNRRLLRDGFVTFPLLTDQQVRFLRSECMRLNGSTGSGFHTDVLTTDPTHRRNVRTVIGGAIDDLLRQQFTSYEPFFYSFLVKYPGPDNEVHIHRDWMYVDERKGNRTYNVWMALEDIVGHNGQLRVLRGSHQLDDMLRGTNLVADWLETDGVIEERLLDIPVRAGHCVVFDNALIHSSYPNHSDLPRVVAAVDMHPVDVPLVTYRRRDDDLAERYDVDADFFCTVNPVEWLQAAPELNVAEVVEIRTSRLTGTDLAQLLDTGMLARSDRFQRRLQRLRARSSDCLRKQSMQATAALRKLLSSLASARELLHRLTRTIRPGTAATDDGGQATDSAAMERVVAWVHDLPTKAAIAVLGVNESMINRFGPATPAIWDPHEFGWTRTIEAGYPAVRAEVEALLAGPKEIPHIEDVTGGIPQGNIGPWRSFVLMHQGRWIDWNCERCPATTELVKQVPGLTMAGFSVLEPGTHITEHRGPNKGALRYQLGVIVPGEPGDCRIRVGDDLIVWADGAGCMFDFTVPHEAWNDSDGIRVLLMLEVVTPLPWYLDRPNRLSQRAMGWFPTTRDITNRLRDLEPTLTKSA